MRMVFTKQNGKTDSLQVIRADGSVEQIVCPKQGIIPHDMVHYAVESVLGARGFMRAVAAGEAVSFAPMDTLEAEAVERLVETMQADAWSPPGTAAELLDLYHLTCDSRGHDFVPVDTMAIEAIRDEITRLQLLWDDVPLGGTLDLTF